MKRLTKIDKGLSMDNAAAIANRLVSTREVRLRSRMRAYADVGAAIKRSASWVRSLVNYGRGTVTDEIKSRLEALLVQGLCDEINRLEADLASARRTGAHPASAFVSEIETHLARARSLLTGGVE